MHLQLTEDVTVMTRLNKDGWAYQTELKAKIVDRKKKGKIRLIRQKMTIL